MSSNIQKIAGSLTSQEIAACECLRKYGGWPRQQKDVYIILCDLVGETGNVALPRTVDLVESLIAKGVLERYSFPWVTPRVQLAELCMFFLVGKKCIEPKKRVPNPVVKMSLEKANTRMPKPAVKQGSEPKKAGGSKSGHSASPEGCERVFVALLKVEADTFENLPRAIENWFNLYGIVTGLDKVGIVNILQIAMRRRLLRVDERGWRVTHKGRFIAEQWEKLIAEFPESW